MNKFPKFLVGFITLKLLNRKISMHLHMVGLYGLYSGLTRWIHWINQVLVKGILIFVFVYLSNFDNGEREGTTSINV